MDIRIIFMLFIMYSMTGWAIEVVNCYIFQRKWINRGFLIGPYCPIYGCGSVLMTLLIPQTNDYVGTFLKAMAICSILEYITSYLMEKLFKTRWWDYTKNKFNLNGRICMQTMALFGLGGVVIVELASPIFIMELNMIPSVALTILSIVLFILFVTDLIISYNIINSFKKLPITLKKDSTEDITNMVKKTLKEKNYLYKRLIISFPDFQSLTRKYDKKINKQIKKVQKEKEKLKKMRNRK